MQVYIFMLSIKLDFRRLNFNKKIKKALAYLRLRANGRPTGMKRKAAGRMGTRGSAAGGR